MSGRAGEAVASAQWARICAANGHLTRGTMSFRLRVVSDQRRSLAERSSVVFGVEGGTIGRSADNDWVLPDPLRYVSAHHARVQFRDGHFYLQDVSTNGVFVNDDRSRSPSAAPSGYRLAQRRRAAHGRLPDRGRAGARDQARDPSRFRRAAVPTSIHALHTDRPRRADATSAPCSISTSCWSRLRDRLEAASSRSTPTARRSLRPRPALAAARTEAAPRQRPLAERHRRPSDGLARPAHRAARQGGRPRTRRTAPARRRSTTCNGTAGILPRRRHRCREAAGGCPDAAAASRRPAVPRGAGGLQGPRAHAQRDPQSLPHRAAAAGAR